MSLSKSAFGQFAHFISAKSIKILAYYKAGKVPLYRDVNFIFEKQNEPLDFRQLYHQRTCPRDQTWSRP